jgi:hypothetical protein
MFYLVVRTERWLLKTKIRGWLDTRGRMKETVWEEYKIEEHCHLHSSLNRSIMTAINDEDLDERIVTENYNISLIMIM